MFKVFDFIDHSILDILSRFPKINADASTMIVILPLTTIPYSL